MGLDLFKDLSTYYINNIDNLFSFFNNSVVVPKPYNKLKKLKLQLLPLTIILIRFGDFNLIILIIIRVIKIIIPFFFNIYYYHI